MLIIPVEHRPDLRNPPWATLLLILINCLVFFSYQLDDAQRIEQVMEVYDESDLMQREVPLYLDSLRDDYDKQRYMQYAWAEDQQGLVVISMLHDLKFEAGLHQRRDYQQAYDWKAKRHEIEQLRDRISYIGYGFIPAQPSLVDAFVSMFLHGDLGHLLGNMLFLFLFGFMLEIALGRGAYIGLYLLSGFGATGLYWLMDMHSYVYGVGASGAISGLMGMYLALYGLKKIQFFYWIGFYFNYFKAPALLLLPFWVGKELFGQLTTDTNVNYWAHIGGMLSGYLLVLGYKRYGFRVDEQYLHKVDELAPLKDGLKKVEQLTADLELDQAKAECNRLLQEYPDHLLLLERLYKLWQNDPKAREFHLVALKIFSLPRGLEQDPFVYEIFLDYQRRMPGTSLLSRNGVAIKLARRFLQTDHADDSLKLVRQVIARGRKEAALPPLLLLLAKQLKTVKPDESRALLRLLLSDYPDSEQAVALKQARSQS